MQPVKKYINIIVMLVKMIDTVQNSKREYVKRHETYIYQKTEQNLKKINSEKINTKYRFMNHDHNGPNNFK